MITRAAGVFQIKHMTKKFTHINASNTVIITIYYLTLKPIISFLLLPLGRVLAHLTFEMLGRQLHCSSTWVKPLSLNFSIVFNCMGIKIKLYKIACCVVCESVFVWVWMKSHVLYANFHISSVRRENALARKG